MQRTTSTTNTSELKLYDNFFNKCKTCVKWIIFCPEMFGVLQKSN